MPVSSLGAVIFDMDGVVTRTAELHAAAWKKVFDPILRSRSTDGTPIRPFDTREDYLTYVDGRPREAGVRSFLAARGIELPEGNPADTPSSDTVQGVAKRKDALFAEALDRDGAQVYPSTIVLIRALRDRGVGTGMVTSSRHGREVLKRAGIQTLFDACLDGIDLASRNLKGKPDPDPFLECARALGVTPARSVLIEDATAGVEAGRRGGFGLVVGVDRDDNRDALAAHGADVVVNDLAELGVTDLESRWRERQDVIAWRIEQAGFDPAREHEMESLFTVGNGYLGVRGVPDTPLPGSLDDLYIAGVYGPKETQQPYSELSADQDEYAFSALVSLPFPFRVELRAADAPLDLRAGRWRTHRRVLDLRHGVLESDILFDANHRRTQLRTRRCASLADLHLLLQEVTVELENHSGIVELNSSLVDPELATRHPQLEALPTQPNESNLDLAHFRTKASDFEIALAARTTLVGSGTEAMRWRVPAQIGQTLIFRRLITVYTSRDGPAPTNAALAHLQAMDLAEFDTYLAAHGQCWSRVWERTDVRTAEQPAVEQALRFNTYHLRIATDCDSQTSIGARTLSGRGYEGHVFWDVDMFMLPFFLHTFPDLAQYLLRYRFHTLDGARRRARKLGYSGACYAWESTVTGDDVTPRKVVLESTGAEIPIRTGSEQIHVTADVAYAVWRYWEATADHNFLRECGVEILAETARFWARRCTRDGDGYHIRGVMGPDEYHHTVDDNAYTNWLTRFNLETAASSVEWLGREFPQDWQKLSERLALLPAEVEGWARIARELYCPQPNRDGVIEQFAGFFGLEDYPLSNEDQLETAPDRLLDLERINQLKLIKQADVLMLLHVFPDQFPREVILANYRYYEPLTDHRSSLSPAIHAAIAARLGLQKDAERYWRQSLWLDLSNKMANSALGVHPACMGGTWQALVFGFLGVHFTDEGPVAAAEAAARLPDEWQSIALKLAWRGQLYPLEVKR